MCRTTNEKSFFQFHFEFFHKNKREFQIRFFLFLKHSENKTVVKNDKEL